MDKNSYFAKLLHLTHPRILTNSPLNQNKRPFFRVLSRHASQYLKLQFHLSFAQRRLIHAESGLGGILTIEI